MTPDQAKVHFEEADRLYRDGNYAEALAILNDLDTQFPNERRILYPRARCLAKLGRSAPAIALCNRLIEEHHYRKAAELKRRVERYGSTAPVADDELSFEALDLNIEPSPNATTIPMRKRNFKAERRFPRWIVVGILVALTLAGAIGVYFSFFA